MLCFDGERPLDRFPILNIESFVGEFFLSEFYFEIFNLEDLDFPAEPGLIKVFDFFISFLLGDLGLLSGFYGVNKSISGESR